MRPRAVGEYRKRLVVREQFRSIVVNLADASNSSVHLQLNTEVLCSVPVVIDGIGNWANLTFRASVL